MLSTMENNKYTVAWNIGSFGHLIKSLIGIQKYKIAIAVEGADSHYPESHLHNLINIIHPHSDDKVDPTKETIKPYFSNDKLTFFPLYLNHIKNKIQINTKEFVQTYWNYKDEISTKCYNIDVANLFVDTDKFIADIEKFLNEKLNADAVDLIQSKKQSNWPFYLRYNQIVEANTDDHSLTPLELAICICARSNGDYKEVFRNINA